jgi:ferric-dicitrate binding protein FerR (iron transport regulator)
MEEILIKYLAGSASDNERELVLQWIKEDPSHMKSFEDLKIVYLTSKTVQKPSGFDKEENWRKIQSRFYKEKYLAEKNALTSFRRKVIVLSVASSAAAILIAFILGFQVHKKSLARQQETLALYNEIVVPAGAKSHIILSDGTKIWLNASSKLKYPGSFSQGSRIVYLEGEAFFDVKKDKKRMFIVRTSNLDVKVYGTQFNVKSYPEENVIQTTLVNGSVAIEPHGPQNNKKTLFLKPNQMAIFYKNGTIAPSNESPAISHEPAKTDKASEELVIKPLNNPVPVTSWKDNRWIIMSEDLESLAIKLERRYNVKISFADESLKRYKFSGTLKNETFEQVLRIIQLSAPITFHIDGNIVIFQEDPMYKKKYDKMISK